MKTQWLLFVLTGALLVTLWVMAAEKQETTPADKPQEETAKTAEKVQPAPVPSAGGMMGGSHMMQGGSGMMGGGMMQGGSGMMDGGGMMGGKAGR